MIPRVNPKLLTQDALYFEFDKEDAWGKRTYKAGTLLKHVRMSETILFLYAQGTTPFIKPKRRSKVIISGIIYDVSDVTTIKAPFSNDTWSYELELTNPRQMESEEFDHE